MADEFTSRTRSQSLVQGRNNVVADLKGYETHTSNKIAMIGPDGCAIGCWDIVAGLTEAVRY